MRVRALAALLLLLVCYGSLFPFDYVAHRPGWDDLHHLLTDWPARLSASDVVGNVLLFAPLGALIPSLSGRFRTRLGWTAGGIAFAWLLQYLQFWYPSRDPSGSDAVFNTFGLLLGLGLAVAAENVLVSQSLRFERGSPLWPVAAPLLLCWVGYRWFPWVPTLDFGNLKDGLRPLAHGVSWLDAPRALHDAAAWSLWFWLARHAPLRWLAREQASRAVACAIFIVLAEPLFLGNAVSLPNLAGLGLAIGSRRWLAAGDARNRWRLIALLAVSLAMSGLAPYRFVAAASNHEFLWLPFAGMLSGSMVLNTASLIEKFYLYGGLVALLAMSGARWWGAGLLVAAELAWIEWLQLSLPGRSAEITDPLLALLLALWLRFALAAASAKAEAGTGDAAEISARNQPVRLVSNRH